MACFPNISSADSAIVSDAASLGQKLGIIISQAISGELRLPRKAKLLYEVQKDSWKRSIGIIVSERVKT